MVRKSNLEPASNIDNAPKTGHSDVPTHGGDAAPMRRHRSRPVSEREVHTR